MPLRRGARVYAPSHLARLGTMSVTLKFWPLVAAEFGQPCRYAAA